MIAGGSAPRVRGTENIRRASLCSARFSPACAGNGTAHTAPSATISVQPRVCGERFDAAAVASPDAGSAPRVRGTGPFAASVSENIRFSPACAGNGSRRLVEMTIMTVQPRVCGERRRGYGRPDDARGSAPRVRGTAGAERSLAVHSRFSPACAGNGAAGIPAAARRPVQPRVCGERIHRAVRRPRIGGSAPRVRGTVDARPGEQFLERFSPACAGNGTSRCPRRQTRAVQPRVCGERTWAA